MQSRRFWRRTHPRSRGRIERTIAALRRTIAAERPLLAHPVYAPGAARVMMQARADIHRLRHSLATS
jgi:hypothetical protein